MKKSELRNLIKEEITAILKEQDADQAMSAISSIKSAVKDLSSSATVQEDPVLQKLLAKYTGLLGKITSYITQKYNVTNGEDSPEAAPEKTAQPKAEKPVVNSKPKTTTSGAPNYSETI
jgi:hypothetical protein